jgi:plastocyanin
LWSPGPPGGAKVRRRELVGRYRVAIVLLLALSPALAIPAYARAAAPSTQVAAEDDFFQQDVVRIAAGGTVHWTNEGDNPHNVIADDGSFRSSTLRADQSFTQRFTKQGPYRYFCSFHGAKGGIGMSGVILVGETARVPGSRFLVGPGRESPPSRPGRTTRVPRDAATIQEAVDRSRPGDLILVSPGVYREAVLVTTPFLTIRGTDRNRVVLEGDFSRSNGVHVIEADGVAVENMTARHYQANGFYWSSVFGYRGSFLTAYDDGDYGIYAFDSVYGQFDHSYAGGHPDSGFYIGQCRPCHAVITDVLSENNGLGYSGTNASGDLQIINSEWRDNMSGITPNTLDSEKLPPQQDALIAGNYVHDNNNEDAPSKPLEYPSLGTGILVAGARRDRVVGNLVEDQRAYGILLTPSLDRNLWFTEESLVRGNVVRRSGRADLALAAPASRGNCFAHNTYRTSLPPAIEAFYGCGLRVNAAGGGDLAATVATLALFFDAQDGDFPHGDWGRVPAPPPQRNMRQAAQAPPDPAIAQTSVPRRFDIRGVSGIRPSDDGEEIDKEVTVMGFPIGVAWWQLLIGVYGFLLPLMLYTAWVSIALWDLIRREQLSAGTRFGWMAVILLIPVIGPIAYYVAGRSPIAPSLRIMLVGGTLAVYVVVAAIGIAVGSG